MALRIEKAFGVKMDTLMRMQSSYDIAQARKREGEIRLPRFHPAAEARSKKASGDAQRVNPAPESRASLAVLR